MRLTSESAPFWGFFVFFGGYYYLFIFLCCIPAAAQNTVRSCVCSLRYVFARTHTRTRARSLARVYLSSRFPQCTIGPGGREGGRERDQKRVSHPADERVKVKAAPSQKKTSHGFLAHFFFFFFEVVQEEGGKRHTFPIALKHGVRQLPSCCTL